MIGLNNLKRNNMNPHYVTLEQAKLLKEKGFKYYCSASYWKETLTFHTPGYSLENGETSAENYYDFPRYYAPEQWQVVEWLRQKGIIIELIVDGWGDDNCVNEEYLCYRIFIWQIGKPKPHHNDDLGALATPQEAYSVAFDYILNSLNNLI